MKNKNGGFTLLELLIVVGLITIMIVISIPTFMVQINETRQSVDENNLRVAYKESLTKMMQTDNDEYSWVQLHSGLDGEDAKIKVYGNLADRNSGPYEDKEDGTYINPPSDCYYIKVIVYSGNGSPDGKYAEVKYEPHKTMGESSETETNSK